MDPFEDILAGLGGDIDKFERKVYEFLKAKKAAEPVETKKKRKSSPGSAKVNAELEAEVVEAEKAAVKAVKEGGKRVTRATKDSVSGLKIALTNVGISCDDEKDVKKYWDKFRGYANDMPEDDYKKHPNLTDHMRDFANLMKEPEEKKVEAVAEAEKPKKKGGRKPKADEAEKKVEAQAEPEKKGDDKEPEKKKPGRKAKAEKPEPEAATGGGAANVKVITLTLTELMERSERLVGTPNLGEYFDPETGETVTGPKEDEQGEDDVVKFDDKTYSVSPVTGRVYEEDDEGLHVFVGFKGAGKFKHM